MPELRHHHDAVAGPAEPLAAGPAPRAPDRDAYDPVQNGHAPVQNGRPEWHHSLAGQPNPLPGQPSPAPRQPNPVPGQQNPVPAQPNGQPRRPVRQPGGRHASPDLQPGGTRLSVQSAVRGSRGAHAKRAGPNEAQRPLWRELPVLFVVAGLLALLTRSFMFQAFRIPSGSMENTLQIGDRVLVNKVVYDFRGIHRGDIVVFNGAGSWDPSGPAPSSDSLVRGYHGVLRAIGIESDGTDYIKRVIGTPGDRVACCNSGAQITVNGVPLSETSYVYPGNSPSEQRFNVTVPPGHVWVMGDHRGDSEDSRYHPSSPGSGSIPENAVVGRAFLIIWPPSQLRSLPIPQTFQQSALSAAQAAADGAASAVPLAAGAAGTMPLAWLRLGRRRARRRRAGRAGAAGSASPAGGGKGYRASDREW